MPYTCNLNTCILKLQDYNFRILVNLGVLRLVCRSFGPERSFGVLTEASVLAEYFRFFLLRLRPNSSAEASAEAWSITVWWADIVTALLPSGDIRISYFAARELFILRINAV